MTSPPITWYDCDGNAKTAPSSLDAFVYGENQHSMAHMELKCVTWEVCREYFDQTLAKKDGLKKIAKENKYWCWILPTTVEVGQAKLVMTTTQQDMRIPFPIVKGEGATLPAFGTPPTLFDPKRQVIDPTLTGSSLPMADGITIVKSSDATVVKGLVSYWEGNGKDMDEDIIDF